MLGAFVKFSWIYWKVPAALQKKDIITDDQKVFLPAFFISGQLRAEFEILLVENTLKSCPQPHLAHPHCRGPAAFLNEDDFESMMNQLI
jgi:hypothetical protein